MTDIENAAEIIPKNLPFTSSSSENQSRIISIVDNLAIDFHTSISSIVPIVIDETNENDDDIPPFSIRKVYKNLIIISLGFLIMYTALNGILALQSSLNAKGNVGVNSLIVINILILFGATFLTGISSDIFGLKWTIVIGEIAYILYLSANIRPIPIFMYISAACLGLASAPLWTCQATYISCIARYHAHNKQKKVENIISLFFGIFFAFYGTSNIWGNLISYFILNQSNNPEKYNCGIYFDPLSKNETDKAPHVNDLTRYILCGIFVGMGIFSMILLLFLDQIRPTKPQPIAQSLKKGLEVVQSLFRWKNIDQLLLIPLTMWTTMENSFLTAQFTRAFVTCLVGIRYIGLVTICFGICNALCSYIFGDLVKYIGRIGCFIIAAILNYASIIVMYFWRPLENQTYVLFIIAGVWGVADAVWQSQVVAAYTVLYSKTDSSAIAKYRLWKAIGSLVTYGYASYITIELTLIILFSFLTVSMVFYGIIEIHMRWKQHARHPGAVINQD
ncbi:unnamed protein product [Rotaria sordida]|uniref:UNC93-like protein n=2 Tax=Rotaria sordida TaxID=392033 RepID=A0A815XYR4_9BILA|nr:unnamed protein product [Rotaria sordida]CAF1563781.1 unnamed protein product [Rotaria sordida]